MDAASALVVLNFWAHWCAPCVRELPALERIHRDYAARGVVVRGVNLDAPEDRARAERLLRRTGVGFAQRWGGSTEEMATLRLGTALPATAILDREGGVAFRIVGEASEAILRERLEWLVGARGGPPPAELVLPEGVTAEHFAEHESGEDEDHHEDEEAGSAVPT